MFQQSFQNDFFGFNAPPPQEDYQTQEQRRIKIEQDRLLRQQQEESLYQLQKQQAEKLELERLKIENEKKQAEEAERQRQLEIQKREEHLLQIAKRRENLPSEPSTDNPDAFMFQFRLPDGQKYFWKILSTHKIKVSQLLLLMFYYQNLFDYIETHEEINRNYFEFIQNYDLIQTLPFLSLQDKKEEIIQEVFQDSRQEILYIKKI